MHEKNTVNQPVNITKYPSYIYMVSVIKENSYKYMKIEYQPIFIQSSADVHMQALETWVSVVFVFLDDVFLGMLRVKERCSTFSCDFVARLTVWSLAEQEWLLRIVNVRTRVCSQLNMGNTLASREIPWRILLQTVRASFQFCVLVSTVCMCELV